MINVDDMTVWNTRYMAAWALEHLVEPYTCLGWPYTLAYDGDWYFHMLVMVLFNHSLMNPTCIIFILEYVH